MNHNNLVSDRPSEIMFTKEEVSVFLRTTKFNSNEESVVGPNMELENIRRGRPFEIRPPFAREAERVFKDSGGKRPRNDRRVSLKSYGKRRKNVDGYGW